MRVCGGVAPLEGDDDGADAWGAKGSAGRLSDWEDGGGACLMRVVVWQVVVSLTTLAESPPQQPDQVRSCSVCGV